jgi:hypothetical protein
MTTPSVNPDPREAPQRRRGGAFFWPIVLISVGTILLLAELGGIAAPDWWLLANLWPVLLILAGVNLLLRRTPLLGALLGLLTVAGMVVVLAFGAAWGLPSADRLNWPSVTLGFTADAGKHQSFAEPLGEATAAEVRLGLGAMPLELHAATSNANLFEAEIDYARALRYEASGDTTPQIVLQDVNDASGFNLWMSGNRYRWDIGLSPEIPLTLGIDAGSGSSQLDLAGLQIEQLSLDGGSGSVRADLPPGELAMQADMGSGSLTVDVPGEADATVELAMGSGSVRLDVARDAALDFRLTNGGSGALALNLPRNAAVQVVVDDRGSGSVNLPRELRQVSPTNDDDTGTWETEGFDSADSQIRIVIADAGSGSISVNMR